MPRSTPFKSAKRNSALISNFILTLNPLSRDTYFKIKTSKFAHLELCHNAF